jgi:hypothetical protein
MQVISKRLVFQTCTTGARTPAGFIADDAEVPEGLVVGTLSVLDPEDGTPTYYALLHADRVSELDADALVTLAADEPRRCLIANMSDAQLATLGLSR